jgi:hypothetical protein
VEGRGDQALGWAVDDGGQDHHAGGQPGEDLPQVGGVAGVLD